MREEWANLLWNGMAIDDVLFDEHFLFVRVLSRNSFEIKSCCNVYSIYCYTEYQKIIWSLWLGRIIIVLEKFRYQMGWELGARRFFLSPCVFYLTGSWKPKKLIWNCKRSFVESWAEMISDCGKISINNSGITLLGRQRLSKAK